MNSSPVFSYRGAIAALVFTLLTAAGTVSSPAQTPRLPQGRTTPVMSTDASVRQELGSLDRYLDANPKLERLLDQNLSRLNEQTFIEHNPEWADLLQRQPGLAGALKSERNFLLHRILNRHATAALSQKDVSEFDRFLGQHPEINGPVRKDPMRLGDPTFLRAHAPLADFYDAHPALSTYVLQLAGSPNAPHRKVR